VYFLIVKDLRLINFRNYLSSCISFNRNINFFIGRNAQGKTNILEAIYMCSNGKSFRTNKDKEIINLCKNQAYIAANISDEENSRLIEIKLDRDRQKIIRLNKTEVETYKEMDTGLNVVSFNPDDLKLIKDGPHERRRFLDSGISQLKPVYNYNVSRYNRLIYQRNNLLKSAGYNKDIESLLEVFDIQISKTGTKIILERNRYVNLLYDICKITHNKICNSRERLGITYHCNVPIVEDRQEMENIYLSLLKNNIKKDLEYGNTEIGPHRDDMVIYIDDNEARIFGSQGQQRTIVLSLKLAEVELIKQEKGYYPVVLLDDVFSELDDERRSILMEYINNMQVFITATDAVEIDEFTHLENTIFNIENGQFSVSE